MDQDFPDNDNKFLYIEQIVDDQIIHSSKSSLFFFIDNRFTYLDPRIQHPSIERSENKSSITPLLMR
ncbi:hypothetical protein DERF_000965 [Dermatophagoides farinae]|uniref:Uncharacterized protein n=1 Tax=Dermatophagoides farinae TaxID=6954 RepID=A0A922I8H2_DERFA|nr:hypothetical protein DERF_000965 [Dermatophagoides farinae]